MIELFGQVDPITMQIRVGLVILAIDALLLTTGFVAVVHKIRHHFR